MRAEAIIMLDILVRHLKGSDTFNRIRILSESFEYTIMRIAGDKVHEMEKEIARTFSWHAP